MPPLPHVGGAGAGEHHQGRRVVHRARHPADGVEEPGTLADEDGGDPPGGAVVDVGHVHRVRLVLGLDALKLGMVDQRVEQRPEGPAVVAEVMSEPRHAHRDRQPGAHLTWIIEQKLLLVNQCGGIHVAAADRGRPSRAALVPWKHWDSLRGKVCDAAYEHRSRRHRHVARLVDSWLLRR